MSGKKPSHLTSRIFGSSLTGTVGQSGFKKLGGFKSRFHVVIKGNPHVSRAVDKGSAGVIHKNLGTNPPAAFLQKARRKGLPFGP